MTIEIFLRLALAMVLGGLVGLEREYRSKEAGFRTHFLVALGSAVFTVISQYGFRFGLGDSSRVAAQIVSGIGFLGAGTIIFQRNFIRGLTTAAGLWVTAAIGMACGCGMYVMAAICAGLVLIGLELLAGIVPPLSTSRIHISFTAPDTEKARNAVEAVRGISREVYSCTFRNSSAEGRTGTEVSLDVKLKGKNPVGRIMEYVKDFSDLDIGRIE